MTSSIFSLSQILQYYTYTYNNYIFPPLKLQLNEKNVLKYEKPDKKREALILFSYIEKSNTFSQEIT